MSECSMCRDFGIRLATCRGAGRRTPLERVQFAADALELYRELHGSRDCEDGWLVMARALGPEPWCAECGGYAESAAIEPEDVCRCQRRTT